MKRSQLLVRIAALLFLAAGARPAYAQGVTLRYQWHKGEPVTYRMTLQTTSVVTGMPGNNEIKVDQTLTQMIKMTVEDVAPDGVATVRQTFESVKMEMNGPMGHIEYDTAVPGSSANPMIQSMRQVLGGMVGESVVVVQAADGSVRKVEGASRILDKIVKGMGDDPSARAASQGLRSLLSDEALTATIEQSFSKFPADPVKAGDTWDGRLSMGSEAAGRMAGLVRFSLKAVEGPPDGGVARVAVALTLKQETAPSAGPNGMVLTLGDARGEGELLFDVAKGRITKSTMKTDLPSTIRGQAPDGSAMSIQNKTTSTMTMELVGK